MIPVEVVGVLRRVEPEDGLLHVERAGLHGVPGLGGRHQREFAAVDHLLGVILGQVQFAHRPVGAGQQRLYRVEVQVRDAAAREAVGGVVAGRRHQFLVRREVFLRLGQVRDDQFEHLVQRTVRGDFDAVRGHVGNGLGFGRGVARCERHGEDAGHFEMEVGAQRQQFAFVEPDVAEFVVGFGQDVHQRLVDVSDGLVSVDPEVFGYRDGVFVLPQALYDVGQVVALADGEVAGHQLRIGERERVGEEVLVGSHLGIDAVDGVFAAFGRREKFLVGHFRFGIDVEIRFAAAQQQRQSQQDVAVFFHSFHGLGNIRTWDGMSG